MDNIPPSTTSHKDYRRQLLEAALMYEPHLEELLNLARNQQTSEDYNRLRTFIDLKKKVSLYVGWAAKKPELRSEDYLKVVVDAISELLPPDKIDLMIRSVD